MKNKSADSNIVQIIRRNSLHSKMSLFQSYYEDVTRRELLREIYRTFIKETRERDEQFNIIISI
jgi:hypothetical protein